MTYDFNELDLRKIDLNLLLVFSALMREGGVGAAAKRLYLGPSAISMALARLREVVGDPLFVRSRRGMEPTSRALALWEDIAPALATIENAVRGAAPFDPKNAERTFRFAAPDDLEWVLIPALLERLEREAPGVRLIVRPADFHSMLDRLDSGDADIVLSAAPPKGIEMRHRMQTLRTETFSVLYDRARVRRRGAIDLKTYVAVPHVLLSVAGDLSGPIDAALARLGHKRHVVAAVAHFPIVPHILKRRRAIANVPTLAASHFARAFDLAISPTPIPSPTFDLVLAWHARTDTDPAHQWLRALITKCVSDLRSER